MRLLYRSAIAAGCRGHARCLGGRLACRTRRTSTMTARSGRSCPTSAIRVTDRIKTIARRGCGWIKKTMRRASWNPATRRSCPAIRKKALWSSGSPMRIPTSGCRRRSTTSTLRRPRSSLFEAVDRRSAHRGRSIGRLFAPSVPPCRRSRPGLVSQRHRPFHSRRLEQEGLRPRRKPTSGPCCAA